MSKAVVVGAGVAGLAAALGLRRDGWDVQLFERSEQVQTLGTALGIWPVAQDVLRRIGVGHLLEGAIRPTGQGGLRTSRGQVLFAIPPAKSKQDSELLAMVSRSALLEAMVAALPDPMIKTGHPITGLADIPADVDLVVAADGLRSTLRTEVFGSRSAPRYAGVIAFRGLVQGDFIVNDMIAGGEVWGDGILFGITQLRPGWTNWYCSVRAPLTSAIQLNDLRQTLAGWPDPIPELINNVREEDHLRHPIFDLAPRLPSTFKGRVVVLGDAAHAMTPHLGMGACQALLDADALTVALADHDVASNDSALAGALRDYDRRRRRKGQLTAYGSRVLGAVAQSRRWAPVRDVALTGLGTLSPYTRKARALSR